MRTVSANDPPTFSWHHYCGYKLSGISYAARGLPPIFWFWMPTQRKLVGISHLATISQFSNRVPDGMDALCSQCAGSWCTLTICVFYFLIFDSVKGFECWEGWELKQRV